MLICSPTSISQGVHLFINFDLHSFKDATCQVWLNLVKCLKIRSGKCEKYMYIERQLVIRKAYILQCRRTALHILSTRVFLLGGVGSCWFIFGCWGGIFDSLWLGVKRPFCPLISCCCCCWWCDAGCGVVCPCCWIKLAGYMPQGAWTP